MKHHIWIASHFHIQKRIRYFVDALKSIYGQTLKPDLVIISYSAQHDVDADVEHLIRLYLGTMPYVVLYQPSRLYQFEHFECIYNYIMTTDINKDIMITFCDDDDMLSPKRIERLDEVIQNSFKNISKYNCMFHVIDEPSTYENIKYITKSNYSESICTSVSLTYFKDFIESDIYRANKTNLSMDIVFDMIFETTSSYTIYSDDKYLYLNRKSLYSFNNQFWKISKLKTECSEYIEFINYLNQNIDDIVSNNPITKKSFLERFKNIFGIYKNHKMVLTRNMLRLSTVVAILIHFLLFP